MRQFRVKSPFLNFSGLVWKEYIWCAFRVKLLTGWESFHWRNNSFLEHNTLFLAHMQPCSFYKHNTAHGEYHWPLWYDDIIISYQHKTSVFKFGFVNNHCYSRVRYKLMKISRNVFFSKMYWREQEYVSLDSAISIFSWVFHFLSGAKVDTICWGPNIHFTKTCWYQRALEC